MKLAMLGAVLLVGCGTAEPTLDGHWERTDVRVAYEFAGGGYEFWGDPGYEVGALAVEPDTLVLTDECGAVRTVPYVLARDTLVLDGATFERGVSVPESYVRVRVKRPCP